MEGLRYNEGKNRLDLIPPKPILGLGEVLTKGANKYLPRNWENGMPWSTVLASAKRHLSKFEEGEDYDDETNLLHIDHLLCNIVFLSEYYQTHPEYDDRPHKYLKQKRIALDIDGVICDFIYPALRLVGIQEDEIQNFNWVPSYKLRHIWDDLKENKDFWINLPALVNPAELKFEPVAYVTSRPIPKEWCEEWIEKNGFSCVDVITLDNGGHMSTHADKAEVLKSLEIDTFVEDNFEQFVNLNSKGICTYLMDTPFNSKHDVGYKRIYHLNEIL